MLLRTLPACRAVCVGRLDSSSLGRRRCRPRVTPWLSPSLGGGTSTIRGRTSLLCPSPPPLPLALDLRRAFSTFCTGGSPWSSPLAPPAVCPVGRCVGVAAASSPGEVRAAAPEVFDHAVPGDSCSRSRCPSCIYAAATAASVLHRYVGAKGPPLSSRLVDQRRTAAP